MVNSDGAVPRDGVIVIYGLRRRERVRRLLDQFARIPCLPHAIFTIDRFGRELAVYDCLQSKTIYVRVLSWSPEVSIEWTTRPKSFGSKLKYRADKRMEEAKTTLRSVTLRYKIDLIRHAKLTMEACNNAS